MPPTKKSRVLVVDDDPVNQLVLEEILSRHFELSTAHTGEEALAQAVSFKPDLILIDLLVQDGNGYEICKQLKSSPNLRFTKIILVSTKALLKDRLFGYQAGADDYIARPFDPDELLAKARVFIRLKSVEEVDRAKDDLINLFSHETRTPLNAIIGFGRLLAESPALPPEDKEFVSTIIDSGMSLLSLSNKAILISRLRQEGHSLIRAKASLEETVADAIRGIPESFRDKNIEISCDTPDMELFIDEHLVETALAFVIENALKFSEAGTSIEVRSVRNQDGSLTISIADQGCGIPQERLESIFEQFGVNDIEHHGRGHGLSLSIVKLVMELHEGRVSAAPNPAGRGSIFTLSFPPLVFQEPQATGIPQKNAEL